MVDYTVLDGYIDKTSKDATPKYRTIFMEDPQRMNVLYLDTTNSF